MRKGFNVRRALPAVMLLAIGAPAMTMAAAPSVEAAQQALEARWLKLKPGSAEERNVLFQSIRALPPNGGSYPFEVTAVVRDYDAGYAANRYYGTTCVGRAQALRYTLVAGANGWLVDGRMTLDSTCKDNPAAGVSAIPLSSLEGTPASRQAGGGQPVIARSLGLAQGAYECWAFSSARAGLNFTILPGGQYLDADGKRGSFTVDAAMRMVFRGGALDGALPAGVTAVYHEPQGRPTVSFRGRDNGEISFCQRS